MNTLEHLPANRTSGRWEPLPIVRSDCLSPTVNQNPQIDSSTIASDFSSHYFSAFAEFEQWHVSGGEPRAGLTSGCMQELRIATQQFQVQVGLIAKDLNTIPDLWQGVIDSSSDAGATESARQLLVEMDRQKDNVGGMIATAAVCKSRGQAALGLLRQRTDDVQKQQLDAQTRLYEACVGSEQAQRNYDKAEAQLSGQAGFRNAFVTGFTLGIHNPIKKAIKKAKKASDIYQQKCATIKSESALLEQCGKALVEINAAVEILTSLDPAFTFFQNALNAALISLGGARDAELHAVGARTEGAAAYYRRNVDKDMQNLFAWIGRFQSAATQS